MPNNSVMPFEQFMRLVDMIDPYRIEANILNHIQSAEKQSPQTEDAKAILRFSKFLGDWKCQASFFTQERDFCKRIAEKKVQASLWPADVLDQF